MPDNEIPFHLPFVKKEQLTKDTYTFYFQRNGQERDFVPGQYYEIKLDIKNPDERGDSRVFTISSSPTNKEFITITTRIIQSSFKLHLAQLQPGKIIQFNGPWDDLNFDERDTSPHVFLAGGIGVTPYHSIISYCIDKNIQTQMTLFASWKEKDEVGPLLIVAGAGTGKTTVITERIKHLITKGKIRPDEILALTFTEKAAKEMEDRVDKIMPYGYTEMWISTFHSFCDSVLRQEALNIGLNPSFRLISEAESILLMREKEKDEVVFDEFFKDAHKKLPNFTYIPTLTDQTNLENWNGEKGRINEEMIKKYIKDILNSKYFFAGPPAMVKALKETVENMGVAKEKIIAEEFEGY